MLNNHLYVVNAYADTVSVIDTRTNRVVDSPIPVGSTPGAAATDALRGRAFVTNSRSGTVSVINTYTYTNTIFGCPIPVGDDPGAVTTDALRGGAYVPNGGSDTVSAIDTITNTALGAPIPVGDGPGGLALGR
ncbi:YncE family protein [Streptomyces sp. NBC_01280]|nr:YncE family protein [Streptomyces sp. NBC_01397]